LGRGPLREGAHLGKKKNIFGRKKWEGGWAIEKPLRKKEILQKKNSRGCPFFFITGPKTVFKSKLGSDRL